MQPDPDPFIITPTVEEHVEPTDADRIAAIVEREAASIGRPCRLLGSAEFADGGLTVIYYAASPLRAMHMGGQYLHEKRTAIYLGGRRRLASTVVSSTWASAEAVADHAAAAAAEAARDAATAALRGVDGWAALPEPEVVTIVLNAAGGAADVA